MRTTVAQIKAARPDAVYVGRGADPRTGHRLTASLYGNPFSLREHSPDECARLYFAYMRANPLLIKQVRRELVGKQLACWCPQPGPCHALILAALADGKDLAEIEQEWRAAGLLAKQTELFD